MQAIPVYTNLADVAALRTEPGASQSEKLEDAARQFSAVFANMLLKSMRQASLGEGILDSKQSEVYRDLFDQQMALQLTQGEGLGIAELIVKQFTPQTRSHSDAGPGAYDEVKQWSEEPQETMPGADKPDSAIQITIRS